MNDAVTTMCLQHVKKYYSQASFSKSNLCDIIINNNIYKKLKRIILSLETILSAHARAHTPAHTQCIYVQYMGLFFREQSEDMGVNHSFNPSHLKKVKLYMDVNHLFHRYFFSFFNKIFWQNLTLSVHVYALLTTDPPNNDNYILSPHDMLTQVQTINLLTCSVSTKLATWPSSLAPRTLKRVPARSQESREMRQALAWWWAA